MDQTTENKTKAIKTHEVQFIQSWKSLMFAEERKKAPLELTEHIKQ